MESGAMDSGADGSVKPEILKPGELIAKVLTEKKVG